MRWRAQISARRQLHQGHAIILDPASALYTAIEAGNLRAYVPGQDDVGHAALAN